jgi:hypothetical protein
MSHGNREQKKFRSGSLVRKLTAQAKANAAFEAETQRLLERYANQNEEQRPKKAQA